MIGGHKERIRGHPWSIEYLLAEFNMCGVCPFVFFPAPGNLLSRATAKNFDSNCSLASEATRHQKDTVVSRLAMLLLSKNETIVVVDISKSQGSNNIGQFISVKSIMPFKSAAMK